VKLGQKIHGYTVITRPSNANAGKCLWAFAEKDGGEYFIKEFLDPKIPRSDGMGSKEDKELRFAECKRFAARHEQVMELLSADHEDAGNLVLAVAFFAEGTRYYKVTPRVNATEAAPHELEPRTQLVLIRTLTDSLRLLHASGIVHGDLKPENVLLAKPRQGPLLVAKLIDFDDAYPAGEPPPMDTIGGNPLYGAPEWLSYLRGSCEPASLDQAVDMFAFGLLVHTYLFGGLPAHDNAYDSPAAAVLDGAPLRWDPRVGGRLRQLLTELTSAEPRARPDIRTVSNMFSTADVLTADAAGAWEPTGKSRVRVNGIRQPSSTRLRINMTNAN
jgi:serine/threonine protein kinase